MTEKANFQKFIDELIAATDDKGNINIENCPNIMSLINEMAVQAKNETKTEALDLINKQAKSDNKVFKENYKKEVKNDLDSFINAIKVKDEKASNAYIKSISGDEFINKAKSELLAYIIQVDDELEKKQKEYDQHIDEQTKKVARLVDQANRIKWHNYLMPLVGVGLFGFFGLALVAIVIIKVF